MSKQRKTKFKKNSIRFHGLCFVLTNHSWRWGLPWSVAHSRSDTPFEKTDFPFARGYQLQKASWLGVGAQVYFPL